MNEWTDRCMDVYVCLYGWMDGWSMHLTHLVKVYIGFRNAGTDPRLTAHKACTVTTPSPC